MDDALLVRGVHDLAEPVEQRHDTRDRQPSAGLRVEHLAQRRAAHQLHRDPQEPVGLGSERVDVRRVRMVEARCELGLAQEPLHQRAAGAVARVQHLDDCLAPQRALLGAIHDAIAALAELRADREVAERAAGQLRVERCRHGDGLQVILGTVHDRRPATCRQCA